VVETDHLIGAPFVYGGRGPTAFDCYGLIMEIYKGQGVNLPDYASPKDQAAISAIFGNQLPLWEEVPRAPGTVALMRMGRLISHCGYMLDNERMIHTIESTGGVTVQRLDVWGQRLIGFYKYVG
jgi:cell wall-associated NlpC family hydrolase